MLLLAFPENEILSFSSLTSNFAGRIKGGLPRCHIMERFELECSILTKLVHATKSFNFLRHSVPHQVSTSVIFNIFQSCVVSIIFQFCSSSWSAIIRLTRKLESLNHKGVKRCFRNNSYSDVLQTSATMPIAYQKRDRDLGLFAGIASEPRA